MSVVIVPLPLRGYELVCPLFDGAIVRPVSPDACIGRIRADAYASFGVRIRTRDDEGENASDGEPEAETMTAGCQSYDAAPSHDDPVGYESTCGAIAGGGEADAFLPGESPTAAHIAHVIRAASGFPGRGVSHGPLELHGSTGRNPFQVRRELIAILEVPPIYTSPRQMSKFL